VEERSVFGKQEIGINPFLPAVASAYGRAIQNHNNTYLTSIR
jgi:hypothetical protein